MAGPISVNVKNIINKYFLRIVLVISVTADASDKAVNDLSLTLITEQKPHVLMNKLPRIS
jgi:hypothetical protein